VCRFDEAPFAVVRLLGHPVHALTEREALDYILRRLGEGRGGWVATHNLDHLRRLHRNSDFEAICVTAGLRTADGKPLIWASRLRGTPLPARVAGSDMTWSLTEAAASAGRSVFLLGGSPPAAPGGKSTAQQAAEVLRQRYTGLKIAGTYCPAFGFESDPAAMEQLKAAVSSAAPDIVYVAIGSPKQERLILQLLPLLPRTWFLGVGISLSFVTGEVRRAPGWMQRCGLEWVHRLWQEPSRLARRYLVEGIPFAVRLLGASVLERFTRRG
jgi:N-acetylglucosaminyldiphosphoundecaprenol N-acetyl-beta-D-mannosaminyltransferase